MECNNCKYKTELEQLKEKLDSDISITMELVAENTELKELVQKLLVELHKHRSNKPNVELMETNIPSISQIIQESESKMTSDDIIDNKLKRIAYEILKEVKMEMKQYV